MRNDLGNYTGKRTPKASPAPLTANDRFNLLKGTFETFARPYRFKNQKPKREWLVTPERRGLIAAMLDMIDAKHAAERSPIPA